MKELQVHLELAFPTEHATGPGGQGKGKKHVGNGARKEPEDWEWPSHCGCEPSPPPASLISQEFFIDQPQHFGPSLVPGDKIHLTLR